MSSRDGFAKAKPIFSIPALLLLFAFLSSPSEATVVYQYTGNTFGNSPPPTAPYTTANFVTATLTLSSPLVSYTGFGTNAPPPGFVSLVLTDGQQTISSLTPGVTMLARINTDASGNIKDWLLRLIGPNGDTQIETLGDTTTNVFQDTGTLPGAFAIIQGNAGVWVTQVSFSITATAGANGSISPSGVVSANLGTTSSFTFAPNAGYHVADVIVDGASVGASASFDFVNVTTNHTIDVTFAPDVVSGPIKVSPESVDFGNVYTRSFSARLVTVSNTGTQPLSVSSVRANNRDFKAVSLCYRALNPGKSCYVAVFFLAGNSPGSQTGKLTVRGTGFEPQEIPLNATVIRRQSH